MKKKLTIDGMSCNHCVMHVTKALENLDGITDVKVKIGKADINVPDGFDTAVLSDAIKDAGYELVGVK